ncbi:MAG: cysteine hydrolase, partial [Pseudomonadota bacterium]
MDDLTHVTVPGDPASFTFNAAETALLMIDMQGDFLCPGGFGEMLGNDVSQLAPTIDICGKLLKLCRQMG